MIKYLRKIRQRLLTENKFSKYLIYAFGEIFLVVIGILIALQINNWNERSKADQKTLQFLLSLKSDLQIDLQEINKVIEQQQLRSYAISKAIELSKDSIDILTRNRDTTNIYRAGKNMTFFPVAGSYKAASNAGIIENIKDEILKRSILNLYEHLYERIKYNGEINDNKTGIVDWESKHIIDLSEKDFAFDIRALLNKDFIHQLGYLNRFVGIYLIRCDNTKNEIETTLMNIDQYIKAHD